MQRKSAILKYSKIALKVLKTVWFAEYNHKNTRFVEFIGKLSK